MILWKFTLREIKNRPGRATLTLLSIVIGVAAVVAVTVGTATTNQACQEMYLRRRLFRQERGGEDREDAGRKNRRAVHSAACLFAIQEQ